ncbi:alpha/beta fold hydrolase [Hydrogenophaga sp.]|uniref:alpha/beta fold hydrolase n=1 Tax=Hydrogenophaga sp. TaxID=1904254 RepID=UPI003F730A2A
MISYPMAVGAITTRVLEAGHGDNVIILVHGTGGRADRWVRNVDALAGTGYHVYAMDLPGHGFASKGPGVACSVPAYRAFLGEFVAAIGASQPVIVGTSLGGHVVASYACEQAGRVRAIALVGSMGLVPIGDEARGRIQAGANNQTREGVAGKMQRVIFDPALVTPEMLEEEWRINNSPGAKESFAALGSYIASDLDKEVVGEQLARADFPTLLVWGDQDKTVAPAIGEKVRALVPDSRLVMLAGAAHTAYYERADDFNAVLVDFLAGRDGQTPRAGVTWS